MIHHYDVPPGGHVDVKLGNGGLAAIRVDCKSRIDFVILGKFELDDDGLAAEEFVRIKAEEEFAYGFASSCIRVFQPDDFVAISQIRIQSSKDSAPFKIKLFTN